MDNGFLIENKIVYCNLSNMSMSGKIINYILNLPYNNRFLWFEQQFEAGKSMLKFAAKKEIPIFSQEGYGNAIIFYPRAFASTFVFPQTVGIMFLERCGDLYKRNADSAELYEMNVFMGDEEILQARIVAMAQQGVKFLSL